MASFATVAVPNIEGQYLGAQGAEAASQASLAGAKAQIESQRLGTEFATERLGQQIERQQPFLETGERSLTDLVSAVKGQGESVTDLPTTRIQRDIITDFLGENAPQGVVEDVLANLESTETEKRKERLSNLANLGLGGVARAAGTGGDIISAATQGVIGGAGITGQSLMQQAIQRQNQQQNLLGALSQLPALYAATRGGQPPMQTLGTQPRLTGVPLGQSVGFGGFA